MVRVQLMFLWDLLLAPTALSLVQLKAENREFTAS